MFRYNRYEVIGLKRKIVTNNPSVLEHHQGKIDIEFIDSYGYFEVLDALRRLVHDGWKLETHPLSGSVKPNETPYKSVAVAYDPKNTALDFQSLQIIEEAIETYNKFKTNQDLPQWTDRVLNDFQLIDRSIIESAFPTMGIDK